MNKIVLKKTPVGIILTKIFFFLRVIGVNNDLNSRLRLLEETAVICENEEKIRNLCSLIMSQTNEKNHFDALCRCRKKLRLLENEKCRKATACFLKRVDLQREIANLCACCDIVLASFGKSVLCSDEPCPTFCCDCGLIIDAFLNLISNAAKFSSSQRVDVTVKSVGDRFVVGVENDGEIDFSAVSKNGGLAAAGTAARLHGGRLLLCKKETGVLCVLEIPLLQKTTVPSERLNFSSLLSDEFSPIHIGLSDVEGAH